MSKQPKKAAKKAKHIRHRPKDLPIVGRLFIANVCMILIPTIILIACSPLLFSTGSGASYLGALSAASNNYGSYAQIRWNYISGQLLSRANDETTGELISYAQSVEQATGSILAVTKDGQTIYSSGDAGAAAVRAAATKMAGDAEKSGDWVYFGTDGMATVRHQKSNGHDYAVAIVNAQFNLGGPVEDGQATATQTNVRAIVAVAIIAAVFMAAMLIVTAITAESVRRPLKKLQKGAEEVAAGNLYYTIDYHSTSELGQTIDSFNLMRTQLLEAQNLQAEREKAQREMIAGAAHDLRSPLTSIKGYVEGLRDNIADTPEKRQRYLKIIYDSTCDMEKLLDDLLTYSKLNLNTIVLQPKKIDICDYMADCTGELKETMAEKDFTVRYFSYCKGPVYVMLDPDNFARVIRNIVSNSIKYRSEGTHGELEFRITQYSRTVLIEIADNGIGVEQNELVHIFDSFYRADKARARGDKASKNSSGLGLSICKQIVNLHGGSIWATSEKGRGLTMHISLPIEKEEETHEHDSDH